MNILLITPSYPNVGNPTEGIFIEQHAIALSNLGHLITVVVCKPWIPSTIAKLLKQYNSLSHLPKFANINNIDIYFARYLHIPKYHFISTTIMSCYDAIIRSLTSDKIKRSFDFIQIHGTWPTGLAAPMISKSLSCPYIVTAHIQDDPRLFNSRNIELYYKMFEKAYAIVAVGTPIVNHFNRLIKLLKTKIITIHNGVDIDFITNATINIPANYQEWGRIVTVANLWPLKGIDLVLQALGNLKDQGIEWLDYTIVGEGPEKQSLKSLAKDLKISNRVRFLGRLNHNETLKEIARADIFCMPSWQEAFGVVYLEAMALGKPVIGCFGQGSEDIFKHEREGLLVKPKDADGLADALKRLINQPSFSKSLGSAGRFRAQQFTWERNAKQYQELYQKCLSQMFSFHNQLN